MNDDVKPPMEIVVLGEIFVLWQYKESQDTWYIGGSCGSTTDAVDMIESLRKKNGDDIKWRTVRRVPIDFNFTQFDDLSAEQLVRAMDVWQKRKEMLDAELTATNKVFDFLRITRIPNEFEEKGIDNLKLAGVGRCSLTPDMHVSIAAERKEEAFQWLSDTGRESLITKVVNPSTLKALVKSVTIKGVETLPDGVFNVSPYTRASITRKGV